jgi:hypothetical protein
MSKKVLTLVAIGVLAVVVGFGARLYGEGGLPSTVLKNALHKFSEIESVRYKSTLTISADTAQDATSTVVTIEVEGANASQPAPRGTATVLAKIPAVPELASFIEPGFVKFEFRFIKDAAYLRLISLPKTSFDLSAIIDQWVRANATPAPDAATPQQLRALQTEFIEGGVIRYTGALPNVVAGGEAMHHYAIAIDKERLISFIPRLVTWTQSVSGRPPAPEDQQAVDQLVGVLRDLPAAAYPTGEVLISRRDGTLRNVTLRSAFAPEGAPRINVTFSVAYSSFNEPVSIDVPASVISLEEAIGRVLGAAGQPAASIAFSEIHQWVKNVSPAVLSDITEAVNLTSVLYERAPSGKSDYLRYTSCTSYILSQAASRLTPEDFDALRAKPAALAALVPDVSHRNSAALIRKDLPLSLYNEYVLPEMLDAYGLAAILEVDRALTGEQINAKTFTASKAACATLPVAARFK